MSFRTSRNNEAIALREAKAKFVSSMEQLEPKKMIGRNSMSILSTLFVLGMAYKISRRRVLKLLPMGVILLSSLLGKQNK